MESDFQAFERAYGEAMPPALAALYADRPLLASAPHRFPLPGRPFVVEVQYYRAVADADTGDIVARRFAFAVDTDGNDLLVDLADQDLPILQREFGDIDRLGFTLAEFLAAAVAGAAHRGWV